MLSVRANWLGRDDFHVSFVHDIGAEIATLKDDSSSWKSSGIKRRDFRHAKDEPEIPPHHRKKSSKWCKGRVGVLHVEALEPELEVLFGRYFTYRYRCIHCGKSLRTTYTK